jgi:hypothetical protein
MSTHRNYCESDVFTICQIQEEKATPEKKVVFFDKIQSNFKVKWARPELQVREASGKKFEELNLIII